MNALVYVITLDNTAANGLLQWISVAVLMDWILIITAGWILFAAHLTDDCAYYAIVTSYHTSLTHASPQQPSSPPPASASSPPPPSSSGATTMMMTSLNTGMVTSRDMLQHLPAMAESREQPVLPELTHSWFDAVKSYSDLDNDSAILSQDSLDGVVDWATTQNSGRPESPLKFDHDEIMRIDASGGSGGANGGGGGGGDNNVGTAHIRARLLLSSCMRAHLLSRAHPPSLSTVARL